MEIRGSISCSEERATCPYPEPDQSIPRPPSYFFRICECFNIHPSTPTSYKLSGLGFPPPKTLQAFIPKMGYILTLNP